MNREKLLQVVSLTLIILVGVIWPQNKPKLQTKDRELAGKEMTILVTAYPHHDKQRELIAKLQNDDFAVLENKHSQKIISVKKASEAPINLAVVVQDNLDWRVNNEIKGLKEFIQTLPAARG